MSKFKSGDVIKMKRNWEGYGDALGHVLGRSSSYIMRENEILVYWSHINTIYSEPMINLKLVSRNE